MRDGRNLRKKKVRNMLAYRYYCMNSSPLAQHMPPDMVAYRVWAVALICLTLAALFTAQ